MFQLIAFHITYMTSMNLIYYHFIEFSLLNLLHIIGIKYMGPYLALIDIL